MARPGLALALVAVLLLAAACGGDDGGGASEEYANDVCSNLSTWVTDVQQTTTSLTDAGLATDREDIESAVQDVGDATDTLIEDLDALGPPETEDGRAAKAELDRLATELRTQVDAVQKAVDSGGGPAAIAASVLTAVSSAADAVDSTFKDLRELDPSGELQDAFENADECKDLRDQVEQIRSD